MSLDYSIKEVNPTTVEIQLANIIDEYTLFPVDYDYTSVTNLYIDFSKVAFLNSEGIKVWVNFSERLGSHNQMSVHYRKCTQMIIDQVNRTMGFLASNAKVTSLYLPIYCNTCDSNFQALQNVDQMSGDPQELFDKIDDSDCGKFPGCKKKWALDFNEKEFFNFLDKK